MAEIARLPSAALSRRMVEKSSTIGQASSSVGVAISAVSSLVMVSPCQIGAQQHSALRRKKSSEYLGATMQSTSARPDLDYRAGRAGRKSTSNSGETPWRVSCLLRSSDPHWADLP